MTVKPRLLGLAVEAVSQFRNKPTKNARLFAALDNRYEIVGFVQPLFSGLENRVTKQWRRVRGKLGWPCAGMSPSIFNRRTAIAEKELQKWDGDYDVILQLQTLFAPGHHERAYCVYTDSTYVLNRRYYPQWASLTPTKTNQWIDAELNTCQKARYVFAKSEFVRQSLIDDYGCDVARVVCVGGGINAPAAPLNGKDYRSQIALFVGFDFDRKGGPVLLRAWDKVHRRLPNAELWIVGPKPPRAVKRWGVSWLGQVADRRRLAELYDRATVFVMPSLFEPYGLVFLEAMGHGLACIGTNHCAMPEIIQDGHTGLLVPPSQPEPLADALISVLSDSQRAEVMGRQSHATALKSRTWDHVAARMEPYIHRIVEQSRVSIGADAQRT